MEDTNYKLCGDISLAVPRGHADKLLSLGDGNCALLYLYTLRCGGSFSPKTAANELRRTENEILKAAEQLREAGIFSPSTGGKTPTPGDSLPEYTVEEIVSRAGKSSEFAAVVTETQSILGKTLSGADMKTLFGIYDYLSLPAEVIILLVNHCLEVSHQRYGPGRLPTMRSIEKEAYIWFNREIVTLERGEEYLRTKRERRETQSEILQIFQIYDRKLSPTERDFVDSWLDMGFTSEAIAMAYDKTVIKTGKLAWNYMNSILNSWHSKGLHTAEQVEAGDGRSSAKPQNYGGASTSGSGESLGTDDDRMNKILNKVKNG